MSDPNSDALPLGYTPMIAIVLLLLFYSVKQKNSNKSIQTKEYKSWFSNKNYGKGYQASFPLENLKQKYYLKQKKLYKKSFAFFVRLGKQLSPEGRSWFDLPESLFYVFVRDPIIISLLTCPAVFVRDPTIISLWEIMGKDYLYFFVF
jgi:hypothetical protein